MHTHIHKIYRMADRLRTEKLKPSNLQLHKHFLFVFILNVLCVYLCISLKLAKAPLLYYCL